MATSTPERSALLRALGLLKPAWKTAAWAIGLSLIVALATSVEPMVQKVIIDSLTGKVVSWGITLDKHQLILIVVGIMAGLTIFRGGSGIQSSILTGRLKILCNRYLVDQAVWTIFNQSLAYHRNARTGEVMSKLEGGVNGFSTAFSDIMINLVPNVLQLVCTLIFMVIMDVRLTLIVIVCVPLAASISMISGKLAAAREKLIIQGHADNSARFQEVLSLAKTVKAFGRERSEHDSFMNRYNGVGAVMMHGFVVDAWLAFCKNRIMDVARLVVLCYGAYLTLNGDITVGVLVAFLGYAGAIFGPMLGLMNASETMRKAKVYCESVFDIIDTPAAVVDRPEAKEIADVRGHIVFDEVCFGYIDDRLILQNINVEFKPGTMNALVGGSGSGKTTLIDMILRFFDPKCGRIFLDGTDLRDIKQESLRSHIGMVLQDTSLFNGTIAENIAYSRPDATQDEIEAAATSAAAHLFVLRKPDRYQTMVGEHGANLSAGERQRIAIARAMLKNPQIYIFDEPSANLDAESEELVSNVIEELAKTKTVIVIAHRLSTVRHADRILVLDSGQVCEQGTHEELIAKKGQYYKLLTTQGSGGICGPCEAK